MPVTVAIQAVLMNIMDFFYIQPQLAATNRAFEEIHNLQLRYDGFSLIQRKNTKRRDETVNLVEDNVLATISATWTAVAECNRVPSQIVRPKLPLRTLCSRVSPPPP